MKEFEKIYSEYYDAVYKYVLILCGDEHWAEEITQTSFFKALKNIKNFRGECKLSVWLCYIAKNTFLTELKKRKKLNDYEPELTEALWNVEYATDKNISDKETAMEIHRIIHKMKEPYKEVFWLRTFGELSFEDIGNIFGKSGNWARVTFYRARMQIMEEMK